VTVHDVDPALGEQARQRLDEGGAPRKIERHDLETRTAGQRRERRLAGAAHDHAVAAPRELPAEIRDRARRSRSVALMGELKDRETLPVGIERKRATIRGGRRHGGQK
jgi:hypothetical protein